MVSMMDPFSKMGLPPIFQQAMANASSNATGTISPGVVDSFLASAGQASPLMQLVLFVYRLLGTQFGLDPSVVITTLGFLWGASKLGSQLYAQLKTVVDRYLMCAMFVSEHDHIYQHLMKWLSHQQSIRNSQYLMAQTVWKGAWEEEEEEMQNALFWTDGGEGDGSRRYLNFSSQAARSSPRYVPAMGLTTFWHNGTYFRIHRKKESFMNTSGWSAMKDLEEVKISCFGRSIVPIKRLLADAKSFYYHDTLQKTAIFRPRAKEVRRDNNMWQQVARRPVRPMRTVVLDSEEKHDVLSDINEYLHPSTPKWYASRGIPLRRGYLFHGPPGTGKTSFSFALAGVFGIDIYVISLQDINVTEEDLAVLFTKLPRRCIILLEDIDTAGLKREDDESEKKSEEDPKSEDDEKNDVKEDKKTKKQKEKEKKKRKKDQDSDDSDDSESSEDDKKSRKKKMKKRGGPVKGGGGNSNRSNRLSIESISLSGLLNAIDGVASHEGRVLIMTTNKPESLDEALIRPGRVDVQVAFMNASSEQAGELFHRMYEASWLRPRQMNAEEKFAASIAKKTDQERKLEKELERELSVTVAELRGIAEEFGRLVPEGLFSPAEIQGFLLKRKKTPRRALDDAPAWIEAAKRQKESKSKVVTVQ